MAERKKTSIEIDPSIHEQVKAEIKTLNELADFEYKNKLAESLEKKKKKPAKPIPLTLRSYSEEAMTYFLRNHVDPRNMGEEKDVIQEVRKLRNNVFSFMQVQERTYIMPFVEDVYKLTNKTEQLEENSLDILNLMEIFLDLQLANTGLSEQEQSEFRSRAVEQFKEKKANRRQQV